MLGRPMSTDLCEFNDIYRCWKQWCACGELRGSTSPATSVWTHFEGVHWAVERRLCVHQRAFVSSSLFQLALLPIPEVVSVASQVKPRQRPYLALRLTEQLPRGYTTPSGQVIESHATSGPANGD